MAKDGLESHKEFIVGQIETSTQRLHGCHAFAAVGVALVVHLLRDRMEGCNEFVARGEVRTPTLGPGVFNGASEGLDVGRFGWERTNGPHFKLVATAQQIVRKSVGDSRRCRGRILGIGRNEEHAAVPLRVELVEDGFERGLTVTHCERNASLG